MQNAARDSIWAGAGNRIGPLPRSSCLLRLQGDFIFGLEGGQHCVATCTREVVLNSHLRTPRCVAAVGETNIGTSVRF